VRAEADRRVRARRAVGCAPRRTGACVPRWAARQRSDRRGVRHGEWRGDPQWPARWPRWPITKAAWTWREASVEPVELQTRRWW